MNILVVIDMQKGFINQNNEFLIKNIEKIAKFDKFDEIIATQFINCKDSQYEKFLAWTDMQVSPKIDFAVNLPKKVIKIQKTSYALPIDIINISGENCERKKGEIRKGDKVYLCGTDYDACVLAIAYQLFDLGIEVHIISDAVGSSAKEPVPSEIIDKIVKRNFGKNCLVSSKTL